MAEVIFPHYVTTVTPGFSTGLAEPQVPGHHCDQKFRPGSWTAIRMLHTPHARPSCYVSQALLVHLLARDRHSAAGPG